MSNNKNPKYDLEERTLEFAKQIRFFIKKLPKSVANFEDGKQVIRSSGSVGANYIEANESLSRKDFLMRAKISRKEAKETRYWLQLINTKDDIELEKERNNLSEEATELIKILSSIIEKSK
ncbi:four helix bundle protein [Patescibacteria group bacterium]|nr:four helix bundle protein [Patescibacteria group bacterium]